MTTDPASIGRYEIHGVLGRGAMGTIYRAHDPEIDRPVAIKLIRADLLAGEERDDFIARFRREARAVGRCAHPNIVAIYDFALHEGNPFLAMEFVDGVTLAQAMRATRQMKLEDVVFLTLQVLDALGAAHALGIVHRDVKPANIMLVAGTRVKVTDFGISKLDAAALTSDRMMIGTPSYMSPEQWRGVGVDPRSDIFSVGVVMYELLAGSKPFEGRNAAEVLSRLVQGPTPDIGAVCPELPGPVCEVITRSLAKTPAARFASAAEMAAALQAAAMESGTQYLDRTLILPKRPADPPELAGRETASATGAGVTATGGSGTGSLGAFDAETLDTLRRKLAEYVGPIARHLVNGAVRSSDTVEALCAALAEQIDRPADRTRFQQEMQRHFGGTTLTTTLRSSATVANLMSASELERLHTALARHVGPLARVLIKRAAMEATSAAALWQALSAHIDDKAARAAFLREAKR